MRPVWDPVWSTWTQHSFLTRLCYSTAFLRHYSFVMEHLGKISRQCRGNFTHSLNNTTWTYGPKNYLFICFSSLIRPKLNIWCKSHTRVNSVGNNITSSFWNLVIYVYLFFVYYNHWPMIRINTQNCHKASILPCTVTNTKIEVSHSKYRVVE